MSQESRKSSISFAKAVKAYSTAKHITSNPQAKVVLAMPRGEVHDIGKVVIGALFKIKGYQVIDLGTLESNQQLLEAIQAHNPIMVGLSCMLTSSLAEMQAAAEMLNSNDIKIPLLLGGPGVTLQMVATQISPHYSSGATIYVKDVSHCEQVCEIMRHPDRRADLESEVKHAEQEVDAAFTAQQSAKQILTLSEARARRTDIDWTAFQPIVPNQLGVHVLPDYDMHQVFDCIDWTTIFLSFGMKGKYPQIFKDTRFGESAKEVFADAQTLLEEVLSAGKLKASAITGFMPANSTGDDIEIYDHKHIDQVRGILHTLRQQALHDERKPYYALSDFVAPKEYGYKDYIGMFVVTCGLGLDELEAEFAASGDEYRRILIKSLADCLAEAFAEHMHLRVRKEFWGYAADEDLTLEQMFRCEFQGIRPAPGYPACPDHSEKELLFRLLDVEKHTRITLSESYAMWPAASVCGFYFAHPQAKYFWLGSIGEDQIEDYAGRINKNTSFVEQQLRMNLNYSK